jgi:hypothetical protein
MQKKTNQMLKQVQHDITVWFWSFCHPEPGPELNSGSTISGSRFLGLRIQVIEPAPWAGFFTSET